WEIVHANKFKPKGFRFNFSTLPVPDDHKGKIYTYGDTKNIVMFNTCKNKILAWQFIKKIISKEGDFELLKMTNQIPRRKDLTTDKEFADFFNDNPKMQIFAVQAKYVKGPDNCPVLKEVFDAISQQFEECVVYGRKSPEKAVKDAAENVNLILLQQ
ncbi:MAG: extracellular solute-binding protein, partial [Ignavibacteriaceae bacterium]